MTPITYISENDKDYARALSAVCTFAELEKLVDDWLPIAPDAYEVVTRMRHNEWSKMRSADFAAFMRGLKREREGKFAGPEFAAKYGAILMPTLMMRVSLIAINFHVPFGLAFLNLKGRGHIVGRQFNEYGRSIEIFEWKDHGR